MTLAMDDLYELLGGQDAKVASTEQVLHAGPANHWRGIEAVGGKLWLTTHRLVFQSHKVNLRAGQRQWPLASIVNVVQRNTLWVVPNGIAVELADGAMEKFVVADRAHWVAAILEARHGQGPGQAG